MCFIDLMKWMKRMADIATYSLLDFANPKAPRITDIFLYLGHARAHDNIFTTFNCHTRATFLTRDTLS